MTYTEIKDFDRKEVTMYQDERLIQIKAYLKEHKRISVNQMMELYNISRDTARRDLVKLEEDHDVVRTRGGAKWSMNSTSSINEPKPAIKKPSQSIQSIANYASSLVSAADTLLLDNSIIVQYFASELTAQQLRIVTNSIALVDLLPKLESLQINLLGGILNYEKHGLFGSSLLEQLDHYYVEKVFLGASGLTQEGIYYEDDDEALVDRAMTKRGKQIIVLIEESAFGKNAFSRGLTFHDVDIIITNKEPEKEYERIFKEHNVELVITNRIP
jgi:DeoR/GlpR family transcriptional regulator of sugar metabolism